MGREGINATETISSYWNFRSIKIIRCSYPIVMSEIQSGIPSNSSLSFWRRSRANPSTVDSILLRQTWIYHVYSQSIPENTLKYAKKVVVVVVVVVVDISSYERHLNLGSIMTRFWIMKRISKTHLAFGKINSINWLDIHGRLTLERKIITRSKESQKMNANKW